MDSVCIISLTLDVTGILDTEIKITEYKTTKETNKKVYFEILDGLDEIGKLKSKFNEIACDLEVNRLQIKSICYSKDKEIIKDKILAKAKEQIEHAKNNVNKLENLFNNLEIDV